jgi:1-acyl-sn-glycerol-3-phosphate acyltransferase
MWIYMSFRRFRPTWRWLFGNEVEGAEHVPAEGPLLLACNHASFLDPWFLGMLMPRAPMRYLLNRRWYERSRAWTWFFRNGGAIPAEPRSPAATVQRVAEALAAGDAVAVFPEGRISRDGRIGRGHLGVGWMAGLAGVPVHPCALRGDFEALPRTRWFPRRHPVSLHLGPPRSLPDPSPLPGPEEVRQLVSDVMEDICRLAGRPEDIGRARPGGPGPDLRRHLAERLRPPEPQPGPAAV